jgi:hypothetical protein
VIETEIVAWLSDIAPNMYPSVAPLNYTTPAVVYNRTSTDSEDDLEGFHNIGWISFQVDVYDPSYLIAKELAHDIRDRLLEMDDEIVHNVSFVNETDMVDETTEVSLHRVMLTFLIYGVL